MKQTKHSLRNENISSKLCVDKNPDFEKLSTDNKAPVPIEVVITEAAEKANQPSKFTLLVEKHRGMKKTFCRRMNIFSNLARRSSSDMQNPHRSWVEWHIKTVLGGY